MALRALPRAGALLVTALLLAVLAWSALAVPGMAGSEEDAPVLSARVEAPIGDFALYALIHQRVAAGENYYAAAMDAQRTHNYPTRPFVTVRLPTLAWLNAALGPGLLRNIEMLLLAAAGALFWRLKGELGAGAAGGAAVLALLGGAGVMAQQAAAIHELAAGLLLSMSLALYRPARWWPALMLAALALGLRELALPFVLLWLAFAASARRWREAAAVAGIVLAFGAVLYFHAAAVAAHALPGDQPSPGWQALLGPALPFYALARMSGLLVLPLWLAGPAGVLALFGWLGLGGRLGWFAALWFAGFFLAMALFARGENFYWVLLVLPAYLAGLAFVPRALGDLWAAIAQRGARQT